MLDRVTFIGSKRIGLRALDMLCTLALDKLVSIVTIDDSEDTRCQLDEFKKLSRDTGKKLHILKESSELKKIIREDSPDMCLVVGWYWVLGEDVLKIVPNGFIGIHSSLLPKYRGGAPLVWAIMNGEKETGVSLFYFDKGMDTGDIIEQKMIKIQDDENIAEILGKAEDACLDLLRKNYFLLLEGKAPMVVQDHTKATYCSQRNARDGKINWYRNNVDIHNAIRAQSHPYPGAFCYRDDKKLYLWKSRLFPKEYYGIPGLVVQVAIDYVIVTCGKGAICIYEVGFEGSSKEIASNVLKYGERIR